MALKEQLAQDLKESMRAKDVIRKNTVQLVRSAILQIEKDNKVVLDDEGVIGVIAKELKKRKDVLPDYEKSGRADLIEALKTEMEILTAYLPEQLSREEIAQIVKEAIVQTGASTMKDMGKIMAYVMPKTKGKADGKTINEVAKELLA